MDQREKQLQIPGICNRFHNFIRQLLLAYAYKSVILGNPSYRNSAKIHNDTKAATQESDRAAHPVSQEEKPRQVLDDQAYNMNNSALLSSSNNGFKQDREEFHTVQDNSANNNEPGKIAEEEAPLPSLEAKPPKKSVSINDRVEEIIDTRNKKIKRKKSRENLTLFEQEEDEHKLKPLKSILKVGSFSGEKSISFVNPTNDG